uniref:SOCS box domain-containing protein n=1 Tax=Periophthalmus magnuspinnatus TaxID=409849 RepID=A0A3B3Z8W4_9GOBI
MDFSEVYSDSMGSVSAAARSGSLVRVRDLVRSGFSLDVKDNRGWNCLHEGAEGHELCVSELLCHGADPNLSCSEEWTQLPLHAAAQFGRTEILQKLIPLIDRSIGHAPGQVSPLYLCVQSDQRGALQLLLREGFSPDAQDCKELLGSDLVLVLFSLTIHSWIVLVRILLSAGATVLRETWVLILKSDQPDLLGPEALDQTQTGLVWMPLLLSAGLEPNALMNDRMFSKAPGPVLNLLLQNLDWSSLGPGLRLVLDQRKTDQTWAPLTVFDSIPSLSHLCRLNIRKVLGSASLMKTTILHQLPVPASLHHFLQFRDVQSAV